MTHAVPSVTTKTNNYEGCNNLVTNDKELATPLRHYFRGCEVLESLAVLLNKVTEVMEKSLLKMDRLSLNHDH